MERISSAHRTCDLILGVGDGKVIQCVINDSMLGRDGIIISIDITQRS